MQFWNQSIDIFKHILCFYVTYFYLFFKIECFCMSTNIYKSRDSKSSCYLFVTVVYIRLKVHSHLNDEIEDIIISIKYHDAEPRFCWRKCRISLISTLAFVRNPWRNHCVGWLIIVYRSSVYTNASIKCRNSSRTSKISTKMLRTIDFKL